MAGRCRPAVLPYFPFEQDVHEMRLGVRALRSDEPLIEVDLPHYADELALKATLLADPAHLRLAAPPGTEAPQWETVTTLLPLLALHHPQHFSLETRGDSWHWRNHLLGTQAHLRPGDPGALPLTPLDWLGRQVQEDLLLLDGTREGLPLIAGQLCFPAGWCLADKLGHPLLDIHTPVPDFGERLGSATLRLARGLKPGRPVTRVNWGISVTPQLDLAPWTLPSWQHLREEVTSLNAGQRCFLRLERQTLSVLPQTGTLLFTLHTYRAPIAEQVEDPGRRRRLAGVLRTLPPRTRDYKGLARFLPPLLDWLDAGA
jgi:dimethylamine monooxygenase subunit A